MRVLFCEHLKALGYAPDCELDADMADFPAAYAGMGCHFLVAEDDSGAISGMAGLKGREICRLYVRPAHRRQGLAVLLIESLMARHGGAGPLSAIVASQNHPARAAFAAAGFSASGTAPDHPKMRHCEILRFQGRLG